MASWILSNRKILAMLGFLILALNSFCEKKQNKMIVFVCPCILLKPLLKISLERQLWNLVDAVLAIGLIISLFSKVSPPFKAHKAAKN